MEVQEKEVHVSMQRPLTRFRSEEYFVYAISWEMFTHIYRDLYGDAMLVPIQVGTNMMDGNQQKLLLPSFATKAWIYSSRNSETLK